MMYGKDKPLRSKKYLTYIKRQKCLVCKMDGGVDAHHIMGLKDSGTGAKTSDLHTIPLCRVHHQEIHGCVHAYMDQKLECLKMINKAFADGELIVSKF